MDVANNALRLQTNFSIWIDESFLVDHVAQLLGYVPRMDRIISIAT